MQSVAYGHKREAMQHWKHLQVPPIILGVRENVVKKEEAFFVLWILLPSV